LKEIKSTQDHKLLTNTFNLKFDTYHVQFPILCRLFFLFLFTTSVYYGKIDWTAGVYMNSNIGNYNQPAGLFYHNMLNVNELYNYPHITNLKMYWISTFIY